MAKPSSPMRSWAARRGVILVALGMLCVAPALGQGFGEPSGFGEAEPSRVFVPAASPDEAGAEEGFFLHDQLLKLLLLLAFGASAVTIIAWGRFGMRRYVLLASVAVLGFAIGGVLCPISAVQNIFVKAGTGYLLLFLVPVVLSILIGRAYCGYVCPFGALQELLHIRRWALRIPNRWIDRIGWAKWLLLAYLVIRIAVTGEVVWSGTTPFKAFFTVGGTPLTLGLSGLFVVVSVFVYRPFCRLFCPLGALLSVVSRLRVFRIRSDRNCVSCRVCDAVCPVGAADSGTMNSGECLLCGACVRSCPAEDLDLRMPRRAP